MMMTVDRRIEVADALEQLDAAHPRQAHVREDDVRAKALEQLERLLRIAGDLGLGSRIR